MRKTGIEFELYVASAYRSKHDNAKAAGIDFDLTLTQFRNMLKAKRCYLTGVELTHPSTGHGKATDVTIDRMDNSKGYIKGNVHAVCSAANNFKSLLEDPKYLVKPTSAQKILNKMKKEIK